MISSNVILNEMKNLNLTVVNISAGKIFGGGVDSKGQIANSEKLFVAANVNSLFSFVVADFISAFFVSKIFL